MSETEGDFVTYGNPLDPIEEDCLPKRKPVKVEDQIVTDENGRRRFHGAFTGGFSAGFFNTVGSQEGWKPSQFISSRNKKAERREQSARDFMDDEDTGEHGICPMSIKVKRNFEDKEARKRTIPTDGPIPGEPVLHKILQPARDTIGVKLLMQMGWKPGQGVGPRLTKAEKSRQRREEAARKVYGYSATMDDLSEEEDFDVEGVTFAPDEFELFAATPKQNSFGLGYKGMDRRPILSSGKSDLSQLTVGKKTIRGQAFGVGAYEEEDDDIYHVEDMSKYDFELGGRHRPSRFDKCTTRDPTCLEGFEKALKTAERKVYPSITVPKDFVAGFTSKTRWDSKANKSGFVERSKAPLTSTERCAVLNEAEKQVKTPSVLPTAPGPTTSVNVKSHGFKPFVYDVAKQARYDRFLLFQKLGVADKLSGIQPASMTEWEKDRERVEFEGAARLYRPLDAAMADRFTPAALPDESLDILKPVARTRDAAREAMMAAAKSKMYGKLTREKYDWVPESLLCKRFNIPEPVKGSLQLSAETTKKAKHKPTIFDFLKNADAADFFKNANTADFSSNFRSGEKSVSTREMEGKAELDSSVAVMESDSTLEPILDRCNVAVEKPKAQEFFEEISEKGTRKDLGSEENLPMGNNVDLFKAIFLSSSDEESDDDDKDGNIETVAGDLKKVASPPERIICRSPPRGIFTNLDLDAMKMPSTDTVRTDTDVSIPTVTTNDISNAKEGKEWGLEGETSILPVSSVEDDELYGPKLPAYAAPVFKPIFKCRKKEALEDDLWVEKTDGDKEESYKRKHKNKKSKKHKNKRKEEKHKRKRKEK